MIKNEYLKDLYMYGDRDIALNQLMKYFHMKDKGFIYSISTEYPCLEECTKDEIKFLTSASALIGYYMQVNNLDMPSWIKDSKLSSNGSIYYNRFDNFVS